MQVAPRAAGVHSLRCGSLEPLGARAVEALPHDAVLLQLALPPEPSSSEEQPAAAGYPQRARLHVQGQARRRRSTHARCCGGANRVFQGFVKPVTMASELSTAWCAAHMSLGPAVVLQQSVLLCQPCFKCAHIARP